MRRNAVLGAVFAVLIVIVGWLIYLNLATPVARPPAGAARPAGSPGGPAAPGSAAVGIGAPALPAGASGAAAAAAARGTCTLYFQGADVGLLFAEERPIDPVSDPNTRARAVLEELAAGPKKDLLPTLPAGTKVREVYFDAAGIAYVDFSREIRDNHPGGSAEEMLTVDAVVNTLARNVPQVKAVQILVEGHAVTTLAGHVDLTRPLRPRTDLQAETR